MTSLKKLFSRHGSLLSRLRRSPTARTQHTVWLATAGLLLLTLLGCGGLRKLNPFDVTPGKQVQSPAKSHLLTFAFRSSPGESDNVGPHNRIDVTVFHKDNAFQPITISHPGALEPGLNVSVPNVPRLSGVVATLALHQDAELVAHCKSNELNLSEVAGSHVTVPLSCVLGTEPNAEVAVLEPRVYVDPTIGLDLVWSDTTDLDSFFERTRSSGLYFSSKSFWEGRPALIEVLFWTNDEASGPRYRMSVQVSEVPSQTVLLFAQEDLSGHDLNELLRGAQGRTMAAQMTGLKKAGPALSHDFIAAEVTLVVDELNRHLPVSQAGNPVQHALRARLSVAAAENGATLLPETPVHLIESGALTAHGRLRIATFNVENLWDDVAGNTAGPLQYDDFNAAKSNYLSGNMPRRKARQAARVLALSGTPDIVGFQELESAENAGRSLEILAESLRPMGYRSFAFGHQNPDKPVSVTTGFASRYPIVLNESLRIDFEPEDLDPDTIAELRRSARNPQVVEVLLPGGSRVRVYNGHWKSKRGDATLSARMRRAFADLIYADIAATRAERPHLDIVVLGDFNTDYRETDVMAGVAQTGDKREMIQATASTSLYNLWFDLPPQERCSYSYSGFRDCIDHIMVNDALYDNRGLQIIDSSFVAVGRAGGLASRLLLGADGAPFRWQSVRGNNDTPARHMGVGYSDHLPLVASFLLHGGDNPAPRKMSAGELHLTDYNTTPEPPQERLPEIVPACTATEGYVNLETLTDVDLPQHLGKCVRLMVNAEERPYVIERRNLFQVGVELENGQRIGLTTTRAYDRNQEYLRQVLQNALSDRVLLFQGRLGWSGGMLSIHADNPAADIALENFEEPCSQESDVTHRVDFGSSKKGLKGTRTPELDGVEKGQCVGFTNLRLIVTEEDLNREGGRIRLETEQGEMRLYLNAPLGESFSQTGAHLVSGFATFLFSTPRVSGLHLNTNGRSTGRIVSAVPESPADGVGKP